MSAATGELSAAVTASVPAIPPVVRLHTHAVADLTQQVLLLRVLGARTVNDPCSQTSNFASDFTKTFISAVYLETRSYVCIYPSSFHLKQKNKNLQQLKQRFSQVCRAVLYNTAQSLLSHQLGQVPI